MNTLLLPLFLSLAHAADPALPSAQISWRHNVASVAILAPPGEHLAPAAPVTGWFRVDGGVRMQPK